MLGRSTKKIPAKKLSAKKTPRVIAALWRGIDRPGAGCSGAAAQGSLLCSDLFLRGVALGVQTRPQFTERAFFASWLVSEAEVFVDGSLVFFDLSAENVFVLYGLADVC